MISNLAARLFFQRPNRLLKDPLAHSRCSDDEGAIGNGFGDGLAFFRLLQNVGGAHGRTRLPECGRIRIHEPQAVRSKIRHGARSCAYVQRIARTHEYDDEIVQSFWFRVRRQGFNSTSAGIRAGQYVV